MVKHRSIAAALGCLLTIGVGTAHAAEGASPEIDGKALLQKNCARCHSIEATGDSPLKGAPPLREVYLKYPIEMLNTIWPKALAPSIATCPRSSSRRSRPTRSWTILAGLVGKPPSQRAPAAMPPSPEGTEPP